MTESESAPRSIVREFSAALALFASAAVLGFAGLVALFKLGLLARSIDILFYRGVVLCVVAAAITLSVIWWIGARWHVATIRDAIAAGVLSFGLNLSFVVIAPVTVDRSVSVFILGYMATDPDRPMSVADLRRGFEDRYLGEWRQIERRMEEQTISGNVAQRNDGFVLTPQGKSFLSTSKIVAWMFDTDPRFVTQRSPTAHLSEVRSQ